jgi:signal transduction histidine kinase
MKVEKEQERLNEELITKNKELEQVLYVTSHDLRSPLVNVEGFSRELEYSLKELMSSLAQADAPSGIQERITPIVKEDIPQSLHYIQMSVSKMNTLLNGILTLSRLGRAELKIEEIDMNEMMTDIIDNHRFRLNESGIKTEIGKLPHCRGDISQINQVFSNLLDNAIKYADPERLCTVTISGYKDKNESVYCIADNGLGIAPEHQDRIFEIFHQLEPQRVKGEGMGLTIVHRIVEKHHGKIWVESELGRGSTFFVSLPS